MLFFFKTVLLFFSDKLHIQYGMNSARQKKANDREILVSLTVNDRPLKWDGEVPSFEICRIFLLF